MRPAPPSWRNPRTFPWQVLTDHPITAYVFNFIVSVFASCWIGLAVGPYAVGEVSDVLTGTGMVPGEALRWSLLLSLSFLAIPAILLLLLRGELIPAEASRLERARAAGEPVGEGAG